MRVGKKQLGWVVLGLLALALFFGQSWLTYRAYTSRFPGANDFLSRWAPGCSLFWYGENPYSEEATTRAQMLMYGRSARPGEDHAPFFYPLYALALVAPFCLTQNYPLAQAFWMTTMLYVVIAGTILSMKAVRWKPAFWLWAVTLLLSTLGYPQARAILLGQYNLFVFLGLSLSLFLLARQSDGLAGACLVLATVKPQMSFLVIPWLLWWTAHQRRWRFWAGFTIAMGIAVGVSFLIVPTWLIDFYQQVTHYDSLAGTPYHSLTWIVTRHFLDLSPLVETIVTAGFGLSVLVITWRYRRSQQDSMLWATAMIALMTNFIAPRVATTGYPVLLFALFLVFRRWPRSRWKQWWIVLTEVVLFIGQWLLFITTIEGDFETAAVYLPFPILLLFALLVDRPRPESREVIGV